MKNKDFIIDFVKKNCFLSNSFGEPTSMLDFARIHSRPTSSSTLSSSLGDSGVVLHLPTRRGWRRFRTQTLLPNGSKTRLLPPAPMLEDLILSCFSFCRISRSELPTSGTRRNSPWRTWRACYWSLPPSRRAKSRPFSAGSWEMSRTLQWRIWGFRVVQVILSLGKKVD
ncbi:hypothetical protein C2S52_022075 [Perilla frutescens var. hirtella]|nr:hypothetical protein C2S52_022075 [Perilla frutescens var. hirtella]